MYIYRLINPATGSTQTFDNPSKAAAHAVGMSVPINIFAYEAHAPFDPEKPHGWCFMVIPGMKLQQVIDELPNGYADKA